MRHPVRLTTHARQRIEQRLLERWREAGAPGISVFAHVCDAVAQQEHVIALARAGGPGTEFAVLVLGRRVACMITETGDVLVVTVLPVQSAAHTRFKSKAFEHKSRARKKARSKPFDEDESGETWQAFWRNR